MEYRIVKTLSNNVVLVRDKKEQEQMVLMSKGIGYNRKTGDVVSDDVGDNRIFKLWNGHERLTDVKYDESELEAVVKNIVQLAKQRLAIESNNLYPALYDHIAFAVDRLRFGLPIENPFVNEISIIYYNEYRFAQTAVDIIKKALKVDMGDAEAGFIALHLHSAMKKSPVSLSLENVRAYNEIALLVSSGSQDSPEQFSAIRAFLLSLDSIVQVYRQNKNLLMPSKKTLFRQFPQSFAFAKKIVEIVNAELNVQLDSDAEAFITVDIERLRQTQMQSRKDL